MNRISRRRLFAVGGSTLGLAAAVAACSGDDADNADDADDPQPRGRARGDVTLLRTSSSIEHVGLLAYDVAIDSQLVETRATGKLLRLFRSHHKQHAALFVGATRDLGGAAVTEPNPAVLEQLKSAINALVDEPTVLALALDFETIAAQTYQSFASEFRDRSLCLATMGVGGSEAGHTAALIASLGEIAVPNAFQSTEQAVARGTGL